MSSAHLLPPHVGILYSSLMRMSNDTSSFIHARLRNFQNVRQSLYCLFDEIFFS